MASPSWLERLKKRWKLENTYQVLVVLLVFACTGFTVLFLKKPVLKFFLSDSSPSSTASIAYYLLILPIYNVILLGYGFLFGQFKFFWEFEKRFFARIFSIFK